MTQNDACKYYIKGYHTKAFDIYQKIIENEDDNVISMTYLGKYLLYGIENYVDTTHRKRACELLICASMLENSYGFECNSAGILLKKIAPHIFKKIEFIKRDYDCICDCEECFPSDIKRNKIIEEFFDFIKNKEIGGSFFDIDNVTKEYYSDFIRLKNNLIFSQSL